jgi:hypothetical protein
MSKVKAEKPKKLADKIDFMGRRQLINGEYQRGFMEGQRHAMESFAALLDTMYLRQNQWEISNYNHSELCRKEISIN